MAPITWRRWLSRQICRTGPVGAFAHRAERGVLHVPGDHRHVVRRLRARGEPAWILDAARAAVREYRELRELLS